MINRLRSVRQGRSRIAFRKLGFESLEGRDLMTGNVIIYNAPGTLEPKAQTEQVQVHNSYSTTHTYTLGVVQSGSGNGTLNKTSVTLAPNTSTNVVFTPTANSSVGDDTAVDLYDGGLLLAETDFSIVSVSFPTDISAPDTPAGMSDRIPTGNLVPTSIPVTISPSLPSGEYVSMEITGGGTNYGAATINGSTSPVKLSSSANITLQGSIQTAPSYSVSQSGVFTSIGNYAAHLHLTMADLHGTPIQSNGFTVANIPVGATSQLIGDAKSPYLGYDLNVTFTDDSGSTDPNDLRNVYIGEEVAYRNATGSFSNVQHQNSNGTYFSGSQSPIQDEQSYANVSGTGSYDVYQTFVCLDAPTGDHNSSTGQGTVLDIDNSGFHINFDAESSGSGYSLTITDTPSTITYSENGFPTNPGHLKNKDGSTASSLIGTYYTSS